MRRFELVLDSIEREGFFLREEYPERNELDGGLGLLGWALWMGFTRGQLPGRQSALALRQ
jgi:hypothetical protein